MGLNHFNRQIANKHLTLLLRQLTWLIVLSLATLTTGVVVAKVSASDPDWPGSTPENISHSSLNRASQADIAVDSSGEIVVVWTDETAVSGRDVYYASSFGEAWSAPQVISDTANASLFPYVLAVGDQHFVAWVEPPIKKVFETPVGTGTTREISSPAAPVYSQPCLVASVDRLHAVFGASDAGVPDLYHASRPLAGTSWPEAQRIYTSTVFFESTDPALAAGPDGNTLHLVWENKGAASRSIMYMSGAVSGNTVAWSPAITLSTGTTFSIRPDIAVSSNGDIHVVWGETVAGDYNEQYVRYTRYDADAGTWSTPAVRVDANPVQVNEDSPTYISPAIDVWEGGGTVKVCVAWHGFREDDPGAEDILLRCSPAGGAGGPAQPAWSSPTENVSRSTTQSGWEVSIRPLLAFDATGALHVVWQERAGSDLKTNYEIYHAASRWQVFLPLTLKDI